MNLSTKMQPVLILAVIFILTFLVVILIISSTQSAYSPPEDYVLEVEEMTIIIGPKPNSTDVSLDTTITIAALSSATLDEFHITPEVSIASLAIEVAGPLSYKQTFYPAQLLKPATSYTISMLIKDKPISWRFTTTYEPYQPTISFYLARYSIWIALIIATITTLLTGSAIWQKKRAS